MLIGFRLSGLFWGQERPLKIELVGIGGPVGTIIADRSWTIQQLQAEIVQQCSLPAWQYRLVHGVTLLESLDGLTVTDTEPDSSIPAAVITLVRQSDIVKDREVVLRAIQNNDVCVLRVALASGFEVDDALNDYGFLPRGNRRV